MLCDHQSAGGVVANRAVWGPLPGGGFGVRISRPGANVLNANLPPKQIAFDTNWLADSKVLIRGTVTTSQTVNFGVTLPYIPKAFVLRGLANNQWQIFNNWDSWVDAGPGQTWTGMFASEGNPIVYNNRIQLTMSGAVRLSYIVLRD